MVRTSARSRFRDRPVPPARPVPPGPTTPIAPSNNFTFGKVKLNKKKGVATLQVKVPGKGKVVLLGSKTVRKSSKTAKAKSTLKLTIKAKGKAAKQLKKKGKAKVKANGQVHPDRRQGEDEVEDREAGQEEKEVGRRNVWKSSSSLARSPETVTSASLTARFPDATAKNSSVANSAERSGSNGGGPSRRVELPSAILSQNSSDPTSNA